MRKTLIASLIILLSIVTPLFGRQQSLAEIAKELREKKNKPAKAALAPPVTVQEPTKPATAAGGTDCCISQLRDYYAQMSVLLKKEDFAELERIADRERTGKTRFPGGNWKIHNFYMALQKPNNEGESTEAEWTAHMVRLQRWVAKNPTSVTAEIALAEAYVEYGWHARGTDYADNVTDDGWKLLNERMTFARDALMKAADLKPKDPEWFVGMEYVALGQGWEKEQARALVDEAMKFEPNYQYYYRVYANFLLPKWYGEPRESEAFADEIANRIGGKQGDAIYFEIDAILKCFCGRDSDIRMDWDRLARGFKADEELYGTSNEKMNHMAYIAASTGHPVEADQMFQRIGDNWDKENWSKRETFDSYKKYASRTAGEFKKRLPMDQLIRTEVQTSEGLRYIEKVNQDVQGRSKALFDGCKADAPMFEVYMVIKENGSVQQIVVFPETAGAQCVTAKLNAAAFGPPPTAGYVVKGYAVPPSNGVQQ